MISLITQLDINWWIFILNVFTTSLIYFYYKTRYFGLDRFMLASTIIFIYIYSGFGASYSSVKMYYSIMYNVVLISYLIGFTALMKMNTRNPRYSNVENIRKYATEFIFLFILLAFIDNGYPDYDFTRLFNPSKPKLYFVFTQGSSSVFVKGLLFYVILIVEPFYIASLYKYRFRPWKLFLFLALPLYIYYTMGGYVARSTFLPYFAIFIFTVYYYYPNYRNKIKLFSIFSFVPLILFSYYFAEWRSGHEVVNIHPLEAVLIVFLQETSYPLHFEKLANLELPTLFMQFIKWLLTLPIPSFIKGNSFALETNYYFTELLTFKGKYSQSFSVILPGNVSESYLLFGKYYFFVLPLIAGMIYGYLYKVLKSFEEFTILRVYFILMFIPLFARAGFTAAIPNVVNGFLFFFLYYLTPWRQR